MTEPDNTIRITGSATYGTRVIDVSFEEQALDVDDQTFVASSLAFGLGAVLAHAVNGEAILGAEAGHAEQPVDAEIVDEDETPTMSTHCRCVPVPLPPAANVEREAPGLCTCSRLPSHGDALRSLALAEREAARLRRTLERIVATHPSTTGDALREFARAALAGEAPR